jgi:hypothetical protein
LTLALRGRFFWLSGLIAAVALMAAAVFLIHPLVTRYVESEAFRKELDKQTSKGLHLEGRYEATEGPAFLLQPRMALLAGTESRPLGRSRQVERTQNSIHGEFYCDAGSWITSGFRQGERRFKPTSPKRRTIHRNLGMLSSCQIGCIWRKWSATRRT